MLYVFLSLLLQYPTYLHNETGNDTKESIPIVEPSSDQIVEAIHTQRSVTPLNIRYERSPSTNSRVKCHLRQRSLIPTINGSDSTGIPENVQEPAGHGQGQRTEQTPATASAQSPLLCAETNRKNYELCVPEYACLYLLHCLWINARDVVVAKEGILDQEGIPSCPDLDGSRLNDSQSIHRIQFQRPFVLNFDVADVIGAQFLQARNQFHTDVRLFAREKIT